jgi:tetratricopeptide (TPR) repeat protein
MKRYLAMSIGLVIPHLSQGQMEFANCHRFRDEESQIRNMRDSNAMLQTMETLVDDLRKLQAELRSQKPRLSRSLLQNCFQSKRSSLNVLIQQAPGSLRDLARFNFLLGQSFEMTQDYSNAYRFYLKAGQADPKDYASRVKAFENFNRHTAQRFRTRDQNLLPPTEVDTFLREVSEITEPLLSGDAPTEVKTTVLATRADLVTRLTGNKALAIKLWQRVFEIDPKHLMALKNLSEYFFSRNATLEAKRYLEAWIRVDTSTQAIDKLATVYAKLDDPTGYMNLRKLDRFSQLESPMLTAVDSWAEAKVGNPDLAIRQARGALSQSPSVQEWAREALVIAHERRALDFLNQSSPGKALSELDAALKVAPDRVSIRRLMARTLFEHAVGPNSAPAKTQDLKKAQQLVQPVLKDPRPDAESLILLARISDKTRSIQTGVKACEVYEAQIGISQPEHMMSCLRLAVAQKNRSWAKPRLDRAQSNPLFKSFERELIELNLSLPDPQ